MKRRTFVKGTLSVGGSAAASVLVPGSRAPSRFAPFQARDPLLTKVMGAMLTMQRDAWEQGVAALAFLELGETEMVVLMAREAAVRQIEDGRLAVISCWDGVTDPAANGEPVLFAAGAAGDARLRLAGDRMLSYLLERAPRRKDGTLYHVANKTQVWVDSMFMAPPFLAAAGHPEEAIRQVEGTRNLLWDPKKKLFSAIWDDAKNDFERKACWGVGNGWAAAGMARVVNALPPAMAEPKKRLSGYVMDVLDGCLARQRPDGLFHDVVDDPTSFVETNLAQMLAYTIYAGVQAGWLKEGYLDRAHRMRDAVHKKVDDHGYVQGVCGSPNFESPGTATEGQAFFLLMEAAARKRESTL
jgi:unsaturated rhamnogalacturonyl hydrolase